MGAREGVSGCVNEKISLRQGNHKFYPKTVKLPETTVPLPRLVSYNLISINIEVGIHGRQAKENKRFSYFLMEVQRTAILYLLI